MSRDPRAIRFVNWWERNQGDYPGAFWMDLFDSWAEPLKMDSETSLEVYLDASAEYHERAYIRSRTDIPGMIVNDLEAIPDDCDEAA